MKTEQEAPTSARSQAPPLDLPAIDAKWQAVWARDGTYETPMDAARPYYCLMMFPYPSAEKLHIGNAFTFSGVDVYGRYQRMRGQDVFEPIGFDAFGIHSENFALKVGEHPATLTARNVEYFRDQQMKRLGLGVDWSHEVDTTKPNYYKWTQWLFLQLFKNGLAEYREGPVKWCPSCLTVLADEQVIDGHCERCGTAVVQKVLKQWFIKTTVYAQEMLEALDTRDWSEKTKTAQRNWIGRSEGAHIDFAVRDAAIQKMTVFSTRPDTLYGATFMVVAADHPQLLDFTAPEQQEQVRAWQASLPAAEASEPDFSVGINLGAVAVHPLTGEQVPIWAAPYVLSGYGTGTIMAVPGHDERDWQFAKAHGLPIVGVISGGNVAEEPWTGGGVAVNSREIDGLDVTAAKARMTELLESKGLGRKHVQFRLRDWLISRQRYWGPPIPIIHCETHGPVAVPEEDLPVVLPEVKDFRPLGTGVSPLATVQEWVNVPCPVCGEPSRRETDVSDNFLDSGWYFLRYPSTDFDDRALDHDRTWHWLPVDMYIGGNEHAVLHLMYSRFLMRALHSMGLVPAPEPFTRFRTNGMITLSTGKMSKSKGNVVNPDEYMDQYGADVLRLYLMFLGPFMEGGEWNATAITGQARFVERVWRAVHLARRSSASETDDQKRLRHRTIKGVQENIEALHYNKAISLLHEYTRSIDENVTAGTAQREDAKTLVQLLAPFAPHVTEELWSLLGERGSVHHSAWPAFDEALTATTTVTIAVQVNGKLRSTFHCPAGLSQQALQEQALSDGKVQEWLGGKTPRRVIVVPDRVVNIVVA